MKAKAQTHKFFSFFLALLLILSFNSSIPIVSATSPLAPVVSGWQKTNFTLKDNQNILCFSGSQPDIVYMSNDFSDPLLPIGTFAYNYRSGESKKISDKNLTSCNEQNGLLYNWDITGANTNAYLLGNAPGEETLLAFKPTVFAADGTSQVYGIKNSRLYYSPDGGKSAEERGSQFTGKIESIAGAAQDGRVLYIVVHEQDLPQPSQGGPIPYKFAVYRSTDTGLTWQRGYEGVTSSNGCCPQLTSFSGSSAPVTNLLLDLSSGGSPSSNRRVFNLSVDGGSTFKEAGTRTLGTLIQYFRTSSGVVRSTVETLGAPPYAARLEITKDGGATWSPLTYPFTITNYVPLYQSENAPDNLFAIDTADLWQSADGGSSWKKITNLNFDLNKRITFLISPYAPTTLIGVKDNVVYYQDLPDADKNLTNRTEPNAVPGGIYFPATFHNMSPLFRKYWEDNGGLAQFGYPKTEAIREYNASDGKIYTIQYYERNRFEYHPENKGTPYEVELGLLGRILTSGRGAEAAFQPVAAFVSNPNFTYFPQTGHSLSYGFKYYWEHNGGLSIYGYPISQEFVELNPDDGKSYTVQYFERARLEYHPENKGTPYEVLLGLLGSAQLRDKGWLK